MYLNYIMTFVNCYGLYFSYYLVGIPKFLMTSLTVTSILMNLSDTSCGLDGIKPFNKYTEYFRIFDRITTYAMLSYCIGRSYKILYYFLNSLDIKVLAIVGLTVFTSLLAMKSVEDKYSYFITKICFDLSTYCLFFTLLSI